MLGPVMSASRIPTSYPSAAQCHGEEGSDRGLAYAAFAAHHGDHVFDVVVGCGSAKLLLPAHHLLFLLWSHLASVDDHVVHALQVQQALTGILLHALAHGAGHGGEGQGERNDAVLQCDVVHHSQLHDASVQVGIHDLCEGLLDSLKIGHSYLLIMGDLEITAPFVVSALGTLYHYTSFYQAAYRMQYWGWPFRTQWTFHRALLVCSVTYTHCPSVPPKWTFEGAAKGVTMPSTHRPWGS